MQNRVFVIGSDKEPLMPCRPARARILLKKGRAVVWQTEPFTIMLLDRTQENCEENQPIILETAPGSETGIALLMKRRGQLEVIWEKKGEEGGKGRRREKKMRKRVSALVDSTTERIEEEGEKQCNIEC